jgi:hypothetical protein
MSTQKGPFRQDTEARKIRRDFFCVPLRLRPALAGCAFALCLISSALSQSNEKFTNPILAGFYPDPSICRVGGDYYTG